MRKRSYASIVLLITAFWALHRQAAARRRPQRHHADQLYSADDPFGSAVVTHPFHFDQLGKLTESLRGVEAPGG